MMKPYSENSNSFDFNKKLKMGAPVNANNMHVSIDMRIEAVKTDDLNFWIAFLLSL